MKKYYAKYTLWFCVFAAIGFSLFVIYGRTMIWGGNGYKDGLVQHYKAICFYAGWLRDIVRTLWTEHRLVIPEWSFSIGYGADIINTLHYYVIGDPFSFFSVLVPLRWMPYFYCGMIVLRLYFAGAFFSLYCFYRNKDRQNQMAVLAGSMLYLFGMFGLYAGTRHPYFLNPMVFLPLLLIGAEKVIAREKPYLFIVSVAISVCSNFYFFYMLVWVTAGYTLFRLIQKYGIHQWKTIMELLVKTGGFGILGIGAGSVVFLPVIMNVIQDSRIGSGSAFHWLDSAGYYKRFLSSFVTMKSPGHWNLMGFLAIGLLAVLFLLFHLKKKSYRPLALLFFILTLLLLLPIGSYVMSAFTYVSSRWVWAYAFLIAYILCCVWSDMVNAKLKEKVFLFAGLICYYLVCVFLIGDGDLALKLAIGCGAVSLCILMVGSSNSKQTRVKEWFLITVMVVNAGCNVWQFYAPSQSSVLEEYVPIEEVEEQVFHNQDIAVAEASKEDKDFYRYAQMQYNNNSTLLSGMHGIQYYWSLSNPAIGKSNEELGILVWAEFNYNDLDSRAALTTLANVRYFTHTKGKGRYVPYGFKKTGSYSVNENGSRKWDVYQNKYSLPFGYTYDQVLDPEEFEAYSMTEKEEALLQGAIVEKNTQNGFLPMPQAEPDLQSMEIPYQFAVDGEHISADGNVITTSKKNQRVVLTFDGAEKCETFLLIKGLKYVGKANDPSIKVIGYDSEDDDFSQTIHFMTPEYDFYSGKEDFALNLGYSKLAQKRIEINLPSKGSYSFDEMSVVCVPKTKYKKNIEKLGEEHLENTVFESDRITGSIEVSSDKLLCLTIPYSKGWHAKVDGVETEIYKTNLMYSGLFLTPGKHTIELFYQTPWLRVGMLISAVTIILLIVAGLLQKKKKEENKNENRNGI